MQKKQKKPKQEQNKQEQNKNIRSDNFFTTRIQQLLIIDILNKENQSQISQNIAENILNFKSLFKSFQDSLKTLYKDKIKKEYTASNTKKADRDLIKKQIFVSEKTNFKDILNNFKDSLKHLSEEFRQDIRDCYSLIFYSPNLKNQQKQQFEKFVSQYYCKQDFSYNNAVVLILENIEILEETNNRLKKIVNYSNDFYKIYNKLSQAEKQKLTTCSITLNSTLNYKEEKVGIVIPYHPHKCNQPFFDSIYEYLANIGITLTRKLTHASVGDFIKQTEESQKLLNKSNDQQEGEERRENYNDCKISRITTNSSDKEVGKLTDCNFDKVRKYAQHLYSVRGDINDAVYRVFKNLNPENSKILSRIDPKCKNFKLNSDRVVIFTDEKHEIIYYKICQYHKEDTYINEAKECFKDHQKLAKNNNEHFKK